MTTFPLACRLLPAAVRDDVRALYTVFRVLDDLVDEEQPEAEARVRAVERWCDGLPSRSPEVGILAELDHRRGLPRDALRDFCAGMRFDLHGGGVVTEADLDRYCFQVAGTVGLTMAAMLGARGAEAEGRAAALGMAMQRTNVLRDIDEDAGRGRVYVASETIERFGGSLRPGRRAALLQDQIARADALYEEGISGIRMLPHGRTAVAAATAMYREILRQIERDGYGEQARRTVVPAQRKLAVAARRVAFSR